MNKNTSKGTGATASVSVITTTSHGDKDNMKQETKRSEMDLMIEELSPKAGEVEAEVTQGVTLKISHSEQYGNGTWDKIPYSIEVSSSVSLKCSQNEDDITIAANVAHDIAREKAIEFTNTTLVKHTENIRELYSGLFE